MKMLKPDHYLTIVYSAEILDLAILIVNQYTQQFTAILVYVDMLTIALCLCGLLGYFLTCQQKRSVNK